jgi:hypothetical protein
MHRPTADHLSSATEMTILKQTQAGSMSPYQPPRSKFMIHDILGSAGSGKFTPSSNDDRTPSPQSKDFSVFLNSIPEHEDESDCDSSKCFFSLVDSDGISLLPQIFFFVFVKIARLPSSC